MTDPVNSNDKDVRQVAASLADARLAGGLSQGYYRTANEALAGLETRITGTEEALREADRMAAAIIRMTERELQRGHMTETIAALWRSLTDGYATARAASPGRSQ